MLRTKGEAGTGNIVEAVRHARAVQREIKRLTTMDPDELFLVAKEMQAPYGLVAEVAKTGRLPVVNFAAGGKLITMNWSYLLSLNDILIVIITNFYENLIELLKLYLFFWLNYLL